MCNMPDDFNSAAFDRHFAEPPSSLDPHYEVIYNAIELLEKLCHSVVETRNGHGRATFYEDRDELREYLFELFFAREVAEAQRAIENAGFVPPQVVER